MGAGAPATQAATSGRAAEAVTPVDGRQEAGDSGAAAAVCWDAARLLAPLWSLRLLLLTWSRWLSLMVVAVRSVILASMSWAPFGAGTAGGGTVSDVETFDDAGDPAAGEWQAVERRRRGRAPSTAGRGRPPCPRVDALPRVDAPPRVGALLRPRPRGPRVRERRRAGGRQNHPPRAHAVQSVRGRDGSNCVCAWEVDVGQTAEVWTKLQQSGMPADLKARLVKIVKVRQRDKEVRFDIYVTDGTDDMCAALGEVLQDSRVRAHRSFWQRVRERAKQDAQDRREGKPPRRRAARGGVTGTQAGGWAAPAIEQLGESRQDGLFKLATWNARGLTMKAVRLQKYLGGAGGSGGVHVMALQETLRTVNSERLQLRGYRVHEVAADRRHEGEHGLAVLVDEALESEELTRSKWHQVVRVRMGGEEWTVVNVYIPNPVAGSTRRAEANDAVRRAIGQHRAAAGPGRLMVLGDWNTSVVDMEREWCSRQEGGLVRVPAEGGHGTFYYTGPRKTLCSSVIDHVLVPSVLRAAVRRVRVDTWFDESDHRPVSALVSCKGTGVVTQAAGVNAGAPARGRPRVDRDKLQSAASIVASHERWGLPQGAGGGGPDEGDDVNEMAEDFVRAAAEVVRPFERGASAGTARRAGAGLSRQAVAACLAKSAALREWGAACGASEVIRLLRWQRYNEAKTTARRAVRDCVVRAQQRRVAVGAALMRGTTGGAMRAWWRWVRQLQAGHGGDRAGVLAVRVRGADGGSAVVKDPQAVREAVREHHAALLRDETGHSVGAAARAHWEAVIRGPGLAPLPRMDDEIAWVEVNEALRVTRNGTAPGVDDVLPELIKAAGEDAALPGFDPDRPSTALGWRLLRLSRAMFAQGVPVTMARAELVQLYKGSGDRQVLDNYRGISLIPLCVKLTTKVVELRIQRAMVEAGRSLNRRQAGFRRREECMAQACALYEILRGQTGLPMNPPRAVEVAEEAAPPPPPELGGGGAGAGGGGANDAGADPAPRAAFALFVDFKKAYDLVPQEAMLRKLDMFGVRGRVLAFVRSLYARSTVCVRTPWGLTEEIGVRRGLRQGCPLSPLVFNIFVDDMLVGCAGIPVARVPSGEDQTGLLFADDVTALASTVGGVQANAATLTKKAELLEMHFGISKCGVLGVGEAARRALDELVEGVRLGGVKVPVVDKYLYLGILFDSTLSTETMIRARVGKGEGALHLLRPVLAARSVPTSMKARMINACLLPVLTYGAELWGIDVTHVLPLQAVLDEACGLVVGRRKAQREALLRELGLHSIKARTGGLVARAVIKYRTLGTVIADLLGRPSTPRGQAAWVQAAGTMTTKLGNGWLQRYPGVVPRGAPSSWSADLAKRRVRQYLGDVELDKAVRTTVTGQRYSAARLLDTRGFVERSVGWPGEAHAVQLLMRMRLGAMSWARDMARLPAYAPLREDLLRARCPCCGVDGTPETAVHFLLECAAWGAPRAQHLHPLLEELTGAGRFPGQPPAGAEVVEGSEEDSRQARFWSLLGGVGVARADAWSTPSPLGAPVAPADGPGLAAPPRPPPPAPPAGGEVGLRARVRDWWLGAVPPDGSREPPPPYIRVARFIAAADGLRRKLLRDLCRAAVAGEDEWPDEDSDDEPSLEDGHDDGHGDAHLGPG